MSKKRKNNNDDLSLKIRRYLEKKENDDMIKRIIEKGEVFIDNQKELVFLKNNKSKVKEIRLASKYGHLNSSLLNSICTALSGNEIATKLILIRLNLKNGYWTHLIEHLNTMKSLASLAILINSFRTAIKVLKAPVGTRLKKLKLSCANTTPIDEYWDTFCELLPTIQLSSLTLSMGNLIDPVVKRMFNLILIHPTITEFDFGSLADNATRNTMNGVLSLIQQSTRLKKFYFHPKITQMDLNMICDTLINTMTSKIKRISFNCYPLYDISHIIPLILSDSFTAIEFDLARMDRFVSLVPLLRRNTTLKVFEPRNDEIDAIMGRNRGIHTAVKRAIYTVIAIYKYRKGSYISFLPRDLLHIIIEYIWASRFHDDIGWITLAYSLT